MNSLENPLYIDWIEQQPHWPGRLGLTIAPGKKGQGQDMAHDRDLTTDLATLKAQGVTLLVNLMEQEKQIIQHGFMLQNKDNGD